MAGREKIKCYEYDLKGKFIQTYDSIAEVREKFFPNDKGKRPLLCLEKDYFKIDNYGYISNYKIGRNKIRFFEKIKNSVFCNENSNIKNEAIEVYNLKMEKIAEFKNMFIAHKLTGISENTIYSQLKNSNKKRNPLPKNELIFKFKS